MPNQPPIRRHSIRSYKDDVWAFQTLQRMNKYQIAAAIVREQMVQCRRSASVAERAAVQQSSEVIHGLMQLRARELHQKANELAQKVHQLERKGHAC